MEPLSSLHLLAEAVRNAGADIAPTYQEYIQLAFAIYNRENETYNFLKRNVHFSLFFTTSKQRHLITV